MENLGIDAKDSEIIEILRENARLSYSDIGKKIGLSRVAVKNRMKVLEDKGVIKGYHAEIDVLSLPDLFPFIAEITTDAPSFQDVTEKLVADERVITLCETANGCTLHAVCLAKSLQSMKSFLREFRDNNSGVTRIYVYNIYDVKKGNVLPI